MATLSGMRVVGKTRGYIYYVSVSGMSSLCPNELGKQLMDLEYMIIFCDLMGFIMFNLNY